MIITVLYFQVTHNCELPFCKGDMKHVCTDQQYVASKQYIAQGKVLTFTLIFPTACEIYG